MIEELVLERASCRCQHIARYLIYATSSIKSNFVSLVIILCIGIGRVFCLRVAVFKMIKYSV